MSPKKQKRGFAAFFILVVLVFILTAVSFHETGQAAPPGAGLEKHQKAGLTCQSCHRETPPQAVVVGAHCMTCHGNLARLIEKSNRAVPNPHASPHISPGEQPRCEECHHIHKPSEVSCLNCHQEFKYKMP